MATPTTSPIFLTEEQEHMLRDLAARFESELRSAHESLRDIPFEAPGQAFRDLENKLVLANLLTSQNLLPMRLVELAPLESYEHMMKWLQDADQRAEVPQRHLKDLEDAIRAMKDAAQIAAKVAELAMMATPFAGIVLRRSGTDSTVAVEERKAASPAASKGRFGVLRNVISPSAVRLELLVLAAFVFLVARTQTAVGEFLRAYSSWLLG